MTWTVRDIPDQSGRLAIVTGATGGLGLETAAVLAGAGCEVVLAGRNPAKGRDAEASIRARHGRGVARFEPLDLADLSSVATFADRTLSAGRPIDILINNAGVMALPARVATVDGFETQLGTNYLGHFALTGRLLPLLNASHARVVQLSSIAHRSGRIRLDDLNHERGYNAWTVYGQSKLAMLMFAIELDRRSRARGWTLCSVAAHPGVARTDLLRNGQADGGSRLFRWGGAIALAVAGQSAEAGALPILMAATMPDATGGEYFGPQGFSEMKGPPGPAGIRPHALDPSVASRLWSASEQMTGVSFG